MDKRKKDKTPEQLVAAIVERGVDDVALYMYGDDISCDDDKDLESLYLQCVEAIRKLDDYIHKKHPDVFL